MCGTHDARQCGLMQFLLFCYCKFDESVVLPAVLFSKQSSFCNSKLFLWFKKIFHPQLAPSSFKVEVVSLFLRYIFNLIYTTQN